jgi:hypothetical protein
MENPPIFHGKTHYEWAMFNSFLYVYRVGTCVALKQRPASIANLLEGDAEHIKHLTHHAAPLEWPATGTRLGKK